MQTGREHLHQQSCFVVVVSDAVFESLGWMVCFVCRACDVYWRPWKIVHYVL